MAQINKPDEYFNTKLYSGTGSSQSITGVGFQPDWTWIKSRGDTSNHRIYDGVRGATKVIYSNLTNVEGTDTNGLTSFDSDGFSLGTEGQSNGSGVNFASWNWLAGGTASSNTDGSITSNVSASTTSGFSIVSWTPTTTSTPQTIGHGLGVALSMMIVRNREVTGDWRVYHSSLGATKALTLNGTNAEIDDNGFWNDVEPTSSVFTTGNGYANTTGGSTDDYIAYCFAEKKGFSKFGSYTGNGNADGTFVYTGFRPAWVMVKKTDATADWYILDNKRNTFNATELFLKPNTNDDEAGSGGGYLDLLSNGFKWRATSTAFNGSGNDFIYMAFAEQPLTGTNGIPCTAR